MLVSTISVFLLLLLRETSTRWRFGVDYRIGTGFWRRRWGPALDLPQDVSNFVVLATHLLSILSLFSVDPCPSRSNMGEINEARVQDSSDNGGVGRSDREAESGIALGSSEHRLGVFRIRRELVKEVVDDRHVSKTDGAIEGSLAQAVTLVRLRICVK